MCTASRSELIQVVGFYTRQIDNLWRQYKVATRDIGTKLMSIGLGILQQNGSINQEQSKLSTNESEGSSAPGKHGQ